MGEWDGPIESRMNPGPGRRRRNPPGPAMQLTDELTAKLAEEIMGGLSMKGACGRLGVVYESFRNWRKHGERDRLEGVDSTWARLSLAIDFARAEQEFDLVDGAKTGVVPERVALFLLERRFPDYQQRQAIEVEGRVEHTDVRARLEARLIRTLEATPDSGEPALDEPSRAGHPLALLEPGGT